MEEPSQPLPPEDSGGLDNAAAAAYLYDLNRKRRKPNFTEPELLTLVELWAQYKTILRGPATDTVMRSTKARVWRKITDEMNRRYPFVLRRVCDIRGKWEKLMCEARACLKVRGLQPCRDQPAASTQRKRPSRILRRIMAINWPQEVDLMPEMEPGQLLPAPQQKLQPMPALQQRQQQQQQRNMQPLPSMQQPQQQQSQPQPQQALQNQSLHVQHSMQQQQQKMQPMPSLQQQQQQQQQPKSLPSLQQQQVLQNQPMHVQQTLQHQQHQQNIQRQPLPHQQHQQSLQQHQPSPQQNHHLNHQHAHLQQNQQHQHLQQTKHIQQQQQEQQITAAPFPIVDIKEDPDELGSSEGPALPEANLSNHFPGLLGLSGCPDEEDEGALRREVLRLQRTKLLKEIEKLDLELAMLRQRQTDKL